MVGNDQMTLARQMNSGECAARSVAVALRSCTSGVDSRAGKAARVALERGPADTAAGPTGARPALVKGCCNSSQTGWKSTGRSTV